jgi:hypothetical protein
MPRTERKRELARKRKRIEKARKLKKKALMAQAKK